MHKNIGLTLPVAAYMLVLAACGKPADEPTAQTAAAPADTAETAAAAQASVETAAISRTAAPDGARVFFITPADRDTVSSPVTVEFGIEGMSVVRAGDATPDSGHHHLIVDADLPDLGQPIPADTRHIHFGDGSSSTQLELEPGEHTLQLLLGDYRHVPHEPPLISERITVIVE
jgi:hypothetical protein